MNGRQIRFAAGLVAEMRTGHVDDSLLQQRQRLRAIALRDDQFDSGAEHVAGEHGDARIAAGDENAVGQVVFGVKELDRSFRGFGGEGGRGDVAKQDRIGGGQIPGERRRRRGDGAAVHAAELHGIAGARGVRLGQQRHLLGGERGGGRGGRERKDVFHVDFEGARQAQGDGGVRHIAAGFDGVDGLAADAGALGEIGCGEAALLAVGRQVVGDGAVVFHCYHCGSRVERSEGL